MENLDAMTEDELGNLWMSAKRPVRLARTLFPERPSGYVRAARDVGYYAINKSTAISCRLRGDITAAQIYETVCERIYDSLPPFARW